MQRVYYSLISTYMGPALSYNSPAAALIPQEFTTASCFTAYCRAVQVELDLDITAGSYNAKVNFLACFN